MQSYIEHIKKNQVGYLGQVKGFRRLPTAQDASVLFMHLIWNSLISYKVMLNTDWETVTDLSHFRKRTAKHTDWCNDN